ncbi:hypothetical protein A6R68_18494 [Neotoma lepida]|uniref:Small ribosomal subunit protein uS5 n=1 Tax=Neotoma lepida TaxID=56216 RepID=A0A1A6HLC3_NEOLE|nr:hypothetical protein A6R68_18494 [Neotoma lepida]
MTSVSQNAVHLEQNYTSFSCSSGTGIISAPVPKKHLLMVSIDDRYTSARGCTATLDNFAKVTFDAISKTYSYLTPNLWKETMFTKSSQEFTDYLSEGIM